MKRLHSTADVFASFLGTHAVQNENHNNEAQFVCFSSMMIIMIEFVQACDHMFARLLRLENEMNLHVASLERFAMASGSRMS